MPEAKPKHSPHLSHSQVNEFLMCGEHYRRHRIVGTIPPAGLAAQAGRAFHDGMQAGFLELMNSGDLKAAAEEVEAAYDLSWIVPEGEKGERSMATTDFHPQPTKDELEDAQAKLKDVAIQTFDHYAGKLRPMAVEQEFLVKVGDREVKGFIDMITEDGRILDWKTGKNAIKENAAEGSPQLALYAHAYEVLTGSKPKEVGLIWAGMRKEGAKFVESWCEPPSDDRIQRVIRRFAMLDHALKNDGPWLPAPDGHWKCTPKFCAFYNECEVRA